MILFVSEALREQPAREGAQVYATELGAHLRAAHNASVIGRNGSAVRLRRRWPGLRTLAWLRQQRPEHLIYLPQNGLTWASAARAAAMAAAAKPQSMEILVLQQFALIPRALLPWARRWRFLAATTVQQQRLADQGVAADLLQPRVSADRIGGERDASDARAALGLSSGPIFLHVGHPRRDRHLISLAPLADTGTLVLVLSDYSPEEPGSLPPGQAVVVRGQFDHLAGLYRAADVYVFPTTCESAVIGIPMSVFEALANGTPVVARRSHALERWADLPGLHLVDTDEELIATAEALVDSTGPTQENPLTTSDCHDDLRVCRQRIASRSRVAFEEGS
jgi:hypothetical protein